MHVSDAIRGSELLGIEEDERLLRGLQAGEDEAFEALVRIYGGRMLAVARRFVRNDDDARDIVQSAYLNAFRSVGQFQGQCLIGTWLHRIVVNTALMKLRSRRRKPETSIDELLPAFQEDGHHVEQFSDWCAPADELMERAETRAIVRACIDRLPENYRHVLILRDVEELSTEESARVLSMTPTAVKVRLHRARQALSTLLRKEFARTSATA
ncbi:MAG TPA: sigma-70 family RNA polymerase sigma factor [Vicinamibacterales bacterium]|nr:sigma-70 family RNA polymerase sigma factor [Vicinamibacterales bacterium]